MSRADDLWRSRIRADATVRPDPGSYRPGTPAFVGKVVSTGSNLGVGKFCRVVPVSITGTEADGSLGVLTAGTAETFAYPVGPGIPATGDYVVVRRVQYRWVFDEPTGGALAVGCYAAIPGCFCLNIPATLQMTSADPACNFSMFQSCSLQYGPTPSWAAPLSLGANSFISTGSFPDPIAGDALFFYHLTCASNQFSLTRIYPTSPYGSPFRDAILYSWLLGGTGNNCGTGGGSTTCCANPAAQTYVNCALTNFGRYPITAEGAWYSPSDSSICNPTAIGSNTVGSDIIAVCGTPPPYYLATVAPVIPGDTGFHLDSGTAFPGSDSTCSVTIDQF